MEVATKYVSEIDPTLAEGVSSDHPVTRSPDHPIKLTGFTMIELIIVISIILILTSIAIPVYKTHVLHAREAVLLEDLQTMRGAIEQYTNDKDKPPQSLEDLISAGYMARIPKDPFTNSTETWEPVMDDGTNLVSQTETGLVSVRSGSKLTGSDGTAYNTW